MNAFLPLGWEQGGKDIHSHCSYNTESSSQHNKIWGWGAGRHTDWKGKNETVPDSYDVILCVENAK